MHQLLGLILLFVGWKIVDGLIRTFSGPRDIITIEEFEKILKKRLL